MENSLLRTAKKQNIKRRQRKWWQRAVRGMGALVVFCTTYALILPALTMEQEAICGVEAHEHVESCYTQQPVTAFACGLEDSVKVVHSHDAVCYDDQGSLICLLPEISEHTHDDSCYSRSETPVCEYVHIHSAECATVQSVLVCGQEETAGHAHSSQCASQTVLVCETPESQGHTHGEGCGSTETVLVCAETEGETHTHGEGCYETKQIPCEIPESAAHAHGEGCYENREAVCTLEELAAHSHSAECYIEQTVFCELTTIDGHVHGEACYPEQLICEKEEIILHTHEAACLDAEGNLICTQPEIAAHAHTESCLAQAGQMQDVLICELEVHVHEDSCYPVEEEVPQGYICGSGVHAHVETCYDEAGELICTIPEHAHDASCIVEDLDLTADVETAEQWKATLSHVTLTGNWPKDIVAVAETQLNYKESEKNLVLADDELKGYTRYGAWYGDPYGDWNAMFASFCLNYAGVQEFPLESDVNRWIAALEEKALYRTPDTYSPKPGDLVFFDYDQKEDAEDVIPVTPDQVAIVAERIPAAEEKPAQLKLIAGDCDDQVSYVTCDMDDVTIVGYAEMPVGEVFYLTYEGADFTVTATLSTDAGIPDTARLTVREILEGTEEYDAYYQQSIEALMDGASADVEVPEISFARIFDINFLADGELREPMTPVDIQIRYNESIPVKENERGKVVHFAEDGVEVLNANTYSAAPAVQEENFLTKLTEIFADETEQIDTFQYTQSSFSVSVMLLAEDTRASTFSTATRVHPYEIDNTGVTKYVLYTRIGNNYYALDGNGYPVAVTVSGDTVTLSGNNTDNLLWSFTAAQGDYVYNPIANMGTGRYLHPYNNGGTNTGTTTGNPYEAALVEVGEYTFKIRGNGQYLQFTNGSSISQAVANSSQATAFYVARAGQKFNVWFDGTDGGMMSYYGSDDLNIPVVGVNGSATFTLPDTWKSPTKYPYTLNGWYNIKTSTYHKPGEEVTITQDAVYYADWVAADYDVGQYNANVVDSVDTSNFITTYVFDYGVLFNVMSQTHTGTVDAGGHNETWTILNNGETVPYNNAKSLGFAFVDYDANGEFSYALARDNTNTNQGDAITPGILTEVKNASGGKDLLDLLFNPSTDVIGKNYVGTGNYLFQYMDSTTDNYDGEHDGYYYLDARLNAASYNQSAQRFYLYNYLERTSDSRKDGGVGEYSDFLPFNSPYQFRADQLDEYTDTIRRPGYEYDAKDGEGGFQEYNSVNDATTNYFFGIRTDIEFFLPNDAGSTDEYGNYGNISTRGEHMIFDFHGDDDVWVFVDGELVLDIGGLHGVMFGQVDFSSGRVITGKDGGTTTTRTFWDLLGHNITEGTHTMTIYYMERGSSQSNCAIYFNIAPRYDLEITKEDIVSAEYLDGAVFTIYNDEARTSPAQLWDSEEAHNEDMRDGKIDNAKSSFTVVDGVAKCWGISAGKTYYIYETTPPPGYPESDDMIRITLNNRGTATIETTTLHGNNGVATEGFAVIKQDINETLKIVALTVTNQQEGDTTEVRVEKTWEEGSTNLPQSITVYLTADGVPIGRRAVLNEGNGWSYTWTGLPKYATEGIDQKIIYEVQEVLVPGYITTQGSSIEVENYIDWIRVNQMSDSKTFLLVHNGQALTYDGRFGWMDPAEAELDTSLSAQWSVTTDHDGFHLKNGLGYTLTYGASGFYGTQSDEVALNQVFYYLNSRLVVHDHDVYYQFGSDGAVVSSDGLAFTLYQKEIMTGFLTNIVNVPVDEEDQTYVEVNKVWGDGADKHTSGSVIIRLFADGKDTGRYITLNAANNWAGGFYDLPYYQEDGKTVVVYTVVEDAVHNYLPEYSDATVLPGLPVQLWQDAVTLTRDGIYRFTSGTYALAVDSEHNVISARSDLDDANQQWKAVSRNNNIVLQNVGSGRYLQTYGSSLRTVTGINNGTAVTISNNLVRIGQVYLEIDASHAGVTSNAANITNQKVSQYVTTTGRPGTGYTVTNLYGTYVLPVTGGMGTSHFTFGGLLFIAAALMYISKFGRKQRKGGKYCQ